ncbi:Phosphatidylinositol 3,4,5-trisphosphate 3-phosphatase and dual-specificity protein phosphatase PTEN [Echinococcus granulosus]|uniref:Phosphatase and tensin n=1 Tax=Echinococcus granulosus TaxID=6210 RepID=A0A068WHJ3_ECHGR|nr:Phosphatidylinositol 3,4,5-trisphosphate 3-phosphatase and dual-specificity protein phosphatase PTEN [Echinococcus granulosus]CDS19567.1 phosphatase and tensin [Echinococcus granulosus]
MSSGFVSSSRVIGVRLDTGIAYTDGFSTKEKLFGGHKCIDLRSGSCSSKCTVDIDRCTSTFCVRLWSSLASITGNEKGRIVCGTPKTNLHWPPRPQPGSTVSSNTFSDHHQQPVPTFENPSFPQQQHPPAKMVNRLKSLVSKKKKRFQADGFDLDLSYISPRIIAMGFPAERIEGLYRNHIDEVSRFFEMRHKGHYKIYHLCNERDFNEYRFSGPVVRYPFSDHNAPQFEQILALCQDVMEFLKQHPENVVAINCKAGKGRTGVMVCACLMELQEARNAEEALRLYAEKRTRNGQGVTIPSQRRYVQYYSRLLSSALTYEPTPLRLTTIRIEGLPHQLHGAQSFELSISTYENRLSINHYHDPTSMEEVSHSQGNSVTPITAAVATITPVPAVSGTVAGTTDNPDYDCHRHSDVTTYQIPCSTHHSNSGSYLIRLDEPVTVFEDFRIKIKAKSGVLTKKIGQCWLNTFFILLNDPATTPTASAASISSTAVTSTGCCSTSDSNSGSGSSSDSSASTASSTSSSVRNSPPHFTRVNEEEEEEELVDEEEEDDEELPTLTSNSTLLHPSPPPSSPPPIIPPNHAGSAVMMCRSSNPFRFAASKAGVSMPFISIPKKDNGPSSYSSYTKKSSPNANLVLAPSMSTQLATPLAVRVLELSQTELDAAAKVRGKKGEEFKVLFEFIRETPCSQSVSTCSSVNSSNPTTSCSSQRPVVMDLAGVEEVMEVEERIKGTTSLPTTYLQHHHHSFHSPAESTTNQTGALVS